MHTVEKEPIVLILAAGMGSRYGGLKQIDPVGPQGEILIDYSLFDAYRAGFRRVVFIIRPEFEADFEQLIGAKLRPFFEVRYAYQELTDIPDKYNLATEREKPLGTAHAIWSARDFIDAPFCVLNADDYYGPAAFQILYDYLKHYREQELVKPRYIMAAYAAGNTVSAYGTVTRGVCQVEDGYLKTVTERTGIRKTKDQQAITFDDFEQECIPLDTPVSMNCWGFGQSLFRFIEKGMVEFFEQTLAANPLRGEYLLPNLIGDNIQNHNIEVIVKNCPEKWFGVTYREDKPFVSEALLQKTQAGVYPQQLW